jgi:hypothetical protein
MNSLLYLAMLIGVGWLAVWAILPEAQRGKGWWPFDMRETASAAETTEGKPERSRADRTRPDRDPAAAASTPAVSSSGSAERAEAGSWRVRSARTLASRRRA